ncbi:MULTISPECIES: hypothetical protein [Legionella]|uniref:Uncharacterized protein n=1 Tax=Legionella drozanskii LLAP-1 TaxID=1212489 RepID=A0A0W0SXE8_9GAMM|nr:MULTISPECIES: hypothetical protein [Legionella]KTC87621.1 hypothetical protein Ldro_1240 [Legionella drozanskii LLAP-1]PJE12447.1 MAG: hypothetical protein CK430_07555 [Legionella sp.]
MKEIFDKLTSANEVRQLAIKLDVENKQNLFDYIMDPSVLSKFLGNTFAFFDLLTTFPENKTKLIDNIFLPPYLKTIVTCGYDVEKLGLWCPEGRKRLFEFIANPAYSNNVSLSPEYIKKFVNLFPLYQSNLYQHLICTANLEKIMNSTYNVKLIVEAFPGCKDELFKLIVKHKILDSLVKKPSDLKTLQEIFSHYPFLTNLTLDEEDFKTTENWKEKKCKEIKKGYLELPNLAFARGAGIGFFCSLELPAEMGDHVGSFLDEKAALQLARSSKLIFQTAEGEQIKSRKFAVQTEKEDGNSPAAMSIHA